MQKLLPAIVTICSNRKRVPVAEDLRGALLPKGSPVDVAATWAARLAAEPALAPAREVYGGRAFREAEAAAVSAEGRLYVVSAGLGLIEADTLIPSYGLTLSSSQADGVLNKIEGGPAVWWSALTAASPYHVAAPDVGLILAALPAPYLAMVAAEWSAWPSERLERLRLFSKEQPRGASAKLAASWMPYDDRVEAAGPGRAGTKTDFAQRALRHFVEKVGVASRSLEDDKAAVEAALLGLVAPAAPKRPRLDDDAVRALIDQHWDAVGGRSGHMLRHLRRELGVACEQGRFKTLFHGVAASRVGAGK